MCLCRTLKYLYQRSLDNNYTPVVSDKYMAAYNNYIKPPKLRGHIVDLTHTLGPQTPVFPGDKPMRLEIASTYSENGYQDYELHLNEHTGTHLDAPIHFIKDGIAVHEIPVHCLCGPLVVLDIRDRVLHNHDATVIPDDILRWEKKYGKIPSNAIIIMNSGWGKYFGDNNAFVNMDKQGIPHFPGWSKTAVEFLLEARSVLGIGVDTLSLDQGASEDFPVHNTWLSNGLWGLENVANLDNIPPSGAFLFVGASKVYGGTGSPVRLIAVI
ncbi:cyclase family protein [Moorena sp. SIO3B2]